MNLSQFAAAIENTALRQVFDCWRAARIDRRAPAWAAIDAMDDPIVREYGWAWQLDAASDQLICFLMGPRLRANYGADAVGRSVHDYYPDPLRDTVDRNFREVIGHPLLHRGHGLIYWREGRADLGERILLPIRLGSAETPDAVLGATEADYTMLGAIAPATQPPIHDVERAPLYED